MTQRVAVFTGTRAEYGLLYWLMRDVQACPDLALQVIAGAMHLAPEFGETWREIAADGFAIDAKVEMLVASNTRVGIAKSIGLGTIGLADALARLDPQVLVILGDRFEALAAAQTALVMGIPIAHLHGGEITEGAYDDAIRHAITKMAHLHFTATEDYRRRVIQMGEAPGTVFNVGAFGLDHLTRTEAISLAALSEGLGFAIDRPYFLVTYHPVTQGDEDPRLTVAALLRALDGFPGHQVILTYPNADHGGRAIIPELERYASERPGRVIAVPSLGFRRYHAALKHASVVVGNSSSGIIEAPSVHVPSVNIGIRQAGRMAADSVVHCAADEAAIAAALNRALSTQFGEVCRSARNPYGQGDAAAQTVHVLRQRHAFAPKRFHTLP